jgi:hypothetical protein
MQVVLGGACAAAVASSASVLSANAWQSTGGIYNYPETAWPGFRKHKSTALVFSGGGSRSYICSLGILRALTDLGLMDSVQYITGISGGSWASSVYTYSQTVDDKAFLGDIVPPANISKTQLAVMPDVCARKAPGSTSFQDVFLKNLGKGVSSAWADAVGAVFLKANGIEPTALFTQDAATLADIRLRNPELAKEQFLLPHANRPFLLMGTALLGPKAMVPFEKTLRSYTLLEISGLYVGMPLSQNVGGGDAVGRPSPAL